MICSAYMKARCLVSSDKCPNYSVHYRSCKNYFPIRRCLREAVKNVLAHFRIKQEQSYGISMQGYGNLTKAVGIPCKAWKSIQCMESPPGVGWKSNQVLQNTWMEIQPSYSKIHNTNPKTLLSNIKVNCCNPMKVKLNF